MINENCLLIWFQLVLEYLCFIFCFVFQHVMNLLLFQLYGTGEIVRSDPIRMQPSVCPDPPQISVTVVGLEERRQLEKLTCDLANKRDRSVFVFWPSYMVSLVSLCVCVCVCMVVCVQWCVTVKYSSLCSLCLQLSVSVILCLMCLGVWLVRPVVEFPMLYLCLHWVCRFCIQGILRLEKNSEYLMTL